MLDVRIAWGVLIFTLITSVIVGAAGMGFIIAHQLEDIQQISEVMNKSLPPCDPTLKATEGYEYFCQIQNVLMWCKVTPQVDDHLKNVPMCQPVEIK